MLYKCVLIKTFNHLTINQILLIETYRIELGQLKGNESLNIKTN